MFPLWYYGKYTEEYRSHKEFGSTPQKNPFYVPPTLVHLVCESSVTLQYPGNDGNLRLLDVLFVGDPCTHHRALGFEDLGIFPKTEEQGPVHCRLYERTNKRKEGRG